MTSLFWRPQQTNNDEKTTVQMYLTIRNINIIMILPYNTVKYKVYIVHT